MQNLRNIILIIINVVAFVGMPYYFSPGFNHIGTQGIESQPNLGFLCIILFLIFFFTAVQLKSEKTQEDVNMQEEEEQISPYTGEKFDPKWGMRK